MLRWVTKPWLLGVVVGTTVSITVTLIVTVWEWIENPGGIFRGSQGTNWNFIADTALSWITPTFFYATSIAYAAILFWFVVKTIRASLRKDIESE